jgi:hypothetical protein
MLSKPVAAHAPGQRERGIPQPIPRPSLQGIRKWWEKGHDQICSKAFDASLFVSCVNLCAVAGCGGTAAVVVSGVLVGGKPMIEALKTLPKRLFG